MDERILILVFIVWGEAECILLFDAKTSKRRNTDFAETQ
jgi:hypothetical protein